jgi:hypothetical protein
MHGVDTPITVGVEDKLKPGTFFYSCACARGRQNVLYTLHGVRGSGHATAHGASLYLYIFIYWVLNSHTVLRNVYNGNIQAENKLAFLDLNPA